MNISIYVSAPFSGLDFLGLETFNGVADDLLEPVLDLHKEDIKRNRDEIKNLPPTQLGSSQRVSNLELTYQLLKIILKKFLCHCPHQGVDEWRG